MIHTKSVLRLLAYIHILVAALMAISLALAFYYDEPEGVEAFAITEAAMLAFSLILIIGTRSQKEIVIRAKDSYLLIKNHPFDNGLINYRRYMRSLGRATGCASRLRFIEAGQADIIIQNCKAVVLCNSTVGLSALCRNKAVYCLGKAIYALPGLAVNAEQMPLADFWHNHPAPDRRLLDDFLRLLKNEALLPGNFYTKEGITDVVRASLGRLGIA